MSLDFTTDYDDFQSTINFAYGDGGPWTCDLYDRTYCRLQTRQRLGSGITEYLAYGGTLGAMLRVRPELGRPGQTMSYTWQYTACGVVKDGYPSSISTGVGVGATSSVLLACPNFGPPETKTGEFVISNDGKFSIYLGSNYGGQISVYITGMRFSMSPKDSSSNPNPAPVGGSQSPSSQNSSPSGLAVTSNPAGSTPSRPVGVGTVGVPDGNNSTSPNVVLPTSFSTIPPFSLEATTAGVSVQNTQVAGVTTAAEIPGSSPVNAPVVVGAVLGTASAISVVIIGIIYFRRRRPQRRKSPMVGPSAIVPFYDDDTMEDPQYRQETPRIAPRDHNPPLPPSARPPIVARGEKQR